MVLPRTTRRELLAFAAGVGVLTSPFRVAFAGGTCSPTSPAETSLGKVRGMRADGISVFRGVPFGSDTGAHRFRVAAVAPGWTGIRDCFEVGAQAPQLLGGAAVPTPDLSTEVGRAIAAWMNGATFADRTLPQSENCLFLNVFTPDASPVRKRPVMVWLHGGGFTVGSGGLALYEGSALARRGDVVVVTVNHRLGALGYLYLGAMHDDFADSGNTGQLDQILALRWVRDNIANLGGDPGNVTMFGESGGGAKVSALLATPSATGLYHKAVIESGAALRMVDKATATEVAERTLEKLGVAKADVHQLQGMDSGAILQAMLTVTMADGGRTIGPVVDGRSLPAHPFDPKAPENSRDIPLLIGTNHDEALLEFTYRQSFGKMTEAEARKRFDAKLGSKAGEVFAMYRNSAPNDSPMYWYASMATDSVPWINSIRLAERKAEQKTAPVYMYRFDWVTPVARGAFRSPHGFEVGFVFDNTQLPGQRDILGTGPATLKLAAIMSQAWINFARAGNPSQKSLAWPAYDSVTRKTMVFDKSSEIVADPDRAKREFWAPMS
jgi:para-nitrobenzyl esterase